MSWFGFKIHHAPWELRVMRLLLAVLVYRNLPKPTVAAQPHPHGIAQLVDLTFLADPQVFAVLKGLLLVPLALFVWGRWMAPSLTYILALWTGVWTLNQSQGAIGHGNQIVGLIVLALWLAHTLGSWLWRRGAPWRRPGLTLDDLSIYWVQQMIAAAYVVAGISKLARSGFQLAPFLPCWLLDVQYMPVQITKTHEELYYAVLKPELLERSAQLAGLFAAHPDLTRLFFSGGLFLELLAFLLLINRAWAAGIGVALYLMHAMIGLTMLLHFSLNQYVILIFLVNVPYWAMVAARSLRARVDGSVAPTPAGPAPTGR
jgi:hypothetical protein